LWIKRLQPRVKAALHEVMYAETREQAREAVTRFAIEYSPKYPKAVATLEKDADVLLTFFDFPAEHWKHLRTSNVIESPFAPVRLRQRVTKGAGSRTKVLLMAYKLLDMAQARWRRLDGAHLPPLVRSGITFADGCSRRPRAAERAYGRPDPAVRIRQRMATLSEVTGKRPQWPDLWSAREIPRTSAKAKHRPVAAFLMDEAPHGKTRVGYLVGSPMGSPSAPTVVIFDDHSAGASRTEQRSRESGGGGEGSRWAQRMHEDVCYAAMGGVVARLTAEHGQ